MSQVVTLDIESIAAGGDGVARHDGLVVFVPRTAPGDRVRVRIRAKGRFARGEVVSLEQASPSRTPPRCPHYEGDRCGGCQLQHIDLAHQRLAKSAIVRDAFVRIGKRDVAAPEVRGVGDGWAYRRKLTLALRRTPSGWRAGLHRLGAPDEIFAVRECPITEPRIVSGFAEVLTQGAALLPPVSQVRASLRRAGDDLLLVIEGGTQWPTARAFADAVHAVAAVWWLDEEGHRRLILDRRAGRDAGASFVQVNAAVAHEMSAYVVHAVMQQAPRHVVDGYAGTGDTADALAALGVTVTAIEFDADASAICASRLAAPSSSITARVEDALPGALPADVVLLNPPRTGVDVAVTHLLATCELPPRAIIYVSCDPATLARDVGRLPGWQVTSLVSFDMFPQTAHVESVCVLIPERA